MLIWKTLRIPSCVVLMRVFSQATKCMTMMILKDLFELYKLLFCFLFTLMFLIYLHIFMDVSLCYCLFNPHSFVIICHCVLSCKVIMKGRVLCSAKSNLKNNHVWNSLCSNKCWVFSKITASVSCFLINKAFFLNCLIFLEYYCYISVIP